MAAREVLFREDLMVDLEEAVVEALQRMRVETELRAKGTVVVTLTLIRTIMVLAVAVLVR